GTATLCLYCRYKIGGATGDTLGAICELAETITFFASAALTGTLI
ncbi:MAG: adenosylcobinamide-GDP ribazoletransferase, partial [Proteobacteria bacterium]|nr:adenosylcobinamide-GDP ribazoletransferase [Pseudomonadota bacterium]MBU1716636.1 adenosylcobinamide-GDP ribazoletransferase [Pseudomonadota bacterium]